MSEEFLDSLIPMYRFLEPSLKQRILFSLMQVKKRDFCEKFEKFLELSEGEKDEWMTFLLPLVRQVVSMPSLKSPKVCLENISKECSIFSDLGEKIWKALIFREQQKPPATKFVCKHIPYVGKEDKEGVSDSLKSSWLRETAKINEKDRKALLSQLYQPKMDLVSPSSSGGIKSKSFSSSSASSFLRTPAGNYGSPKTPMSSGVVGRRTNLTLNNYNFGTPKTPINRKNIKTMIIDDTESEQIMKTREEIKKTEKLELEKEHELEKQRRKTLAEERKLAKLLEIEDRKREREERKKAKSQEMEGKRLKLMAEKEARQSQSSTLLPEIKSFSSEISSSEAASTTTTTTSTTTSSLPNNSLLSAIFESANVLKPSDRQIISDFVLNQKVPDGVTGIFHILMNETQQTETGNGETYFERIIFEINCDSKAWRKLRRKIPSNVS